MPKFDEEQRTNLFNRYDILSKRLKQLGNVAQNDLNEFPLTEDQKAEFMTATNQLMVHIEKLFICTKLYLREGKYK